MNLVKRGSIYWLTVTINGQRIRESTQTSDMDLAQQYALKRCNDLYKQLQLGARESQTVEQAIEVWLDLNQDKKDIANDRLKAKFFIAKCGQDGIETITRSRMIDLVADKVAAATKNRYTSFMSAVITEAANNDRIEQVPRFKYFKEEKREVELPKEFELKVLWAAMPYPHNQAAQFALATGLRKSNVYGLTWDQVDFERRTVLINGSSMKNGKALRVPLNDEAYAAIMACQSLHADYCFGNKPLNFNTWKNALKRAGLPSDTRWHDLRHYFASRLAIAGVPLLKIKALGGWSSIQLLDRYAHLSPLDCGQ